MGVDRRTALSMFYREEFLRHIEQLQAAGILDESNGEVAEQTRRACLARLDQVCLCRRFPLVAERLLQNFEALSGLCALEPHQRH